jgi:hypothetical protein
VAAHPLLRDRRLWPDASLDQRIHQVGDVLADPGYGRRDVQEIGGYRTLISAPLIADDEVVGAISLWRTKVEPLTRRNGGTSDLHPGRRRRTQCVPGPRIGGRRRELARKVEQLQALNEVRRPSLGPVLDEVLFKIILNAVRFAECDGGSTGIPDAGSDSS